MPNPEALHALRSQVKDLLAEKRYHQIVDLLTDETLAEYNDGELYMERGSIFARFNEPDRAIIDLTKAATLGRSDPTLYFTRGCLFYEKKDFLKAGEDFSKAIELRPDYTEAYIHRGNCRHAIDNNDLALEDFEFAIRLDPNSSPAYNNVGTIWEHRKGYDKAIENFNRAIELDPKNAHAYVHRGNAWYNKGEFKRAISDYEKAISIDSEYKDLQPLINDTKLKIGEKVDIEKVVDGGKTELAVQLKSSNLYIAADFILRLFILGLYFFGYIRENLFSGANFLLFDIEIWLLDRFEKSGTRKIKKRISPEYAKTFNTIKVTSEPRNRPIMIYVIAGVVISFWYFHNISDHSEWYHYIWIALKTVVGVLAFGSTVALVGSTPVGNKVLGYKIRKTKNGATEDISKYFPDVLPVKQTIEKVIELDEHDLNDTEIARLESDLKDITTKVDAYMLESVLLGALAFSGFLTLVSSRVIDSNFWQVINELIANGSSLTDVLDRLLVKDNLFILIMLESIICSVFFILVLTLRLRFSNMSLKMDYLIRIMNIFNAKEEELHNIRLEYGGSDNLALNARSKRLSEKISTTLEDAKELLKKIKPVVTLMSLYRNLGIITFYLVLVSSGMFFSPTLSLFIFIIAVCTYLFRIVETNLTLEKVRNLLKRH